MPQKTPAAHWLQRFIRFYWWGGGLLLLLAIAIIAFRLHWGQALQAADASYVGLAPLACTAYSASGNAQGERSGAAGRTRARTEAGIAYRVITPRNYAAQRAHPLLLVYAPAGIGAGLSERAAGLTQPATAAGFVVVYVGSVALSPRSVADLAAIPAAVAAQWCIDPARVYATGHSDGGTMAQALAVLPAYAGMVQAIAPSGAGWRGADFAAEQCPAPMPVLILHGADDQHFPGFGTEAAQWWAACNGCDTDTSGETTPEATAAAAAGANITETTGHCRHYSGCAAETTWCAPELTHWHWAGTPEQIIAFFARQADPAPARPGAVWMF